MCGLRKLPRVNYNAHNESPGQLFPHGAMLIDYYDINFVIRDGGKYGSRLLHDRATL